MAHYIPLGALLADHPPRRPATLPAEYKKRMQLNRKGKPPIRAQGLSTDVALAAATAPSPVQKWP
jgi:hypothetical protein